MGQHMTLEDLKDIEESLTGKSLLIGASICAALCLGVRLYMLLAI